MQRWVPCFNRPKDRILVRVKNPSSTVIFTSPAITASGNYSYSFTGDAAGTGTIEVIYSNSGSGTKACSFTMDDALLTTFTESVSTVCGTSKDYRFGFNGMESDDEVYGDDNEYTTFFRQYDPRIGRWLSHDPVVQPWQSPYTGLDNNPIIFTDPLGDKVKFKDKESRREARKLRKESIAFRRKFREMKQDKRVTYNLDHTKGAGRNMEAAVDQELEALESKPNQVGPVIEWEVLEDDGGSGREPMSTVNFTPMQPVTLTQNNFIPMLTRTIQPINIAPPPPPTNPFIPPPGQNAWFNRNVPFVNSWNTVVNPTQVQNNLQQLATALINNPTVNLTIFGNASILGSNANLNTQVRVNGGVGTASQLMLSRARTIRNMLVTLGVPRTQIQVGVGRVFNDGRVPNVTFRTRNIAPPTP